MEFARIKEQGQITLPISIRRELNLKVGDKVAFIEKDGSYELVNPTVLAFKNAQKAFEGEAERLGLKDIDDVNKMIKECRAERRTENAGNA